MQKCIFVVGPTASGKSALALELAEKHQGCIINCDSVQLYDKVQIGAAKPSREELQRVPHHLVGLISPPHEVTAGEYTRLFHEQMKQQEKQSQTFTNFVVGGTGFYFLAIEKGMYPVTHVSEQILFEVRESLKTPEGALQLYKELQTKDPEAAQKISPNDHYRIERTVSLMRHENKSLTQIQTELKEKQKDHRFSYPLKKIGIRIDRDVLRKKVTERTDLMLKAGLVDEVKMLIEAGHRHWAPLSSVGYGETCDYLENKITTLSELREMIITGTMQLAKKQRTWFQRDLEIEWIDSTQVQKYMKEFHL